MSDLKNEVIKKKKSGWHGGKRNDSVTYERQQYRGGRANRKGKTKNLIKLEDGGLKNQHNVIFTQEEKKELERLVNTANRKRMRMLEEEASLPRLKGGKPTGGTVGDLQILGKESDFILARKSKSLQRFKSKEDFENYLDNLRYVNSKKYLDDRTELYMVNHITALENVFGHEADDVIDKIASMSPADYRKLLQQDEDLEVSYIYDPSEASAKLNTIRLALGMELKEEAHPQPLE